MQPNYLPLVSLIQNIGKLGFFLSTIFGFIIIFLTLFGVRKIFGTYKYFIVIFTSLSLSLVAVDMILHPNMHFYNSGFVFFTLVQFFESKLVMLVVLSSYGAVYSITISLIAVQFIYRYCAIFSLKNLKFFRGFYSLIWILYCLFFGASWLFANFKLLEGDKTSEAYFKDQMLLHYNAIDIPMRTFLAYDPIDGSIRWKDCLYTVTVTGIMSFQYLVMIYCGLSMYLKMEEKLKNFSSALKVHHRQLFKTLVLQITTPTIFLFSPLVLVIYLPFFQFEISFPAGAAFCAFSFFPPMDSIIILTVVSEYRLAARRLLKTFLRKVIGKMEKKEEINATTEISLSVL